MSEKPNNETVSQSRRKFLVHAAGMIAGATLTACGDGDTSAFAPQRVILDTCTVLYPEDFGLDPYDVAPAINAAIEAAAAGGGCVVELGKSRSEYQFRSDIWLNHHGSENYVTLRGTSRSIILRNVGGSGLLGPALLHIHRKGILQTLRVSGAGYSLEATTKGVNSGADASTLGNADFWTIEDCEIDGFPYSGINFGDYTRNCIVRRTIVRDNGDAGIQIGRFNTFHSITNNNVRANAKNGIDCNGSDCTISGNECYGNGHYAGATSDRHGIFIAGVLGASADRNKATYNNCHHNTRAGIFAGEGSTADTEIRNNTSSDNTGAGIMVQEPSVNLKITDNTVERNSEGGIWQNSGSGVTYAEFLRNSAVGNAVACWRGVIPTPDASNTCA